MKVILAQGNPTDRYDRTRHNVGFAVIDHYAMHLAAAWQDKPKLKALVAELTIDDQKVLLVKPVTYYNDTGVSARIIMDFYKLDPANDLLVIHDDLALPFGTIRVRKQGSDAGNNGIKSLNAHVGVDYSRIRVGIWNELRDTIDDASFVLSKFTKTETDKLNTDITPHIIELIDTFLVDGLTADSSTF